MKSRPLLLLLVTLIQGLIIWADTNSQDHGALRSLTQDWSNKPNSWLGADPCTSWDGVRCENNRVTSIRWASMDLTGQLAEEIASLSELKYLALNSNGLTGSIPASIGNLSTLTYLDLSANKLSGKIPVSDATTPGLDQLLKTKHFHFGVNKLSGEIPEALFSSDMTLLHVLFDNNQFTGSIPSTLGHVQSLESVRLDNNLLDGLPTNLKNLTNLQELQLSNNKLSGDIPDLTGLKQLDYVDMSNNSFLSSAAPEWFSTLTSLTTLMMENTGLEGAVPSTLFSFTSLQKVILKNNQLNGTLELGTDFGDQLQLIDLGSNIITAFNSSGTYDFQLILSNNPYCHEDGAPVTYCPSQPQQSELPSYSTPPKNCIPGQCSPGEASSPNCKCSSPYTGTLVFRSPSFSNLGISTYYTSLESALMKAFQTVNLPVDSVSLSSASRDQYNYLHILLEVFPVVDKQFNRTVASFLGFVLSNQLLSAPTDFGPYYFLATEYPPFSDGSSGKKHSVSPGLIAGIAVGVSILLLLLICAGFYAYVQRGKANKATLKTDPFASWEQNKSFGDIPQLKGTKSFSFEELKRSTQNFSDANNIGAGGYGKVYKGILDKGQVVAIKRAQMGSMQGAVEFKNEIELLSRVHHKNLVNLTGFCYEQGEQMLVYEFMPNGTLMDSLSGRPRFRLDWFMRLKIALGSARGLAYLHELADPPIIHRDIKSSNILLDERLNAKVADFGLSKAFGDDQSYVTTQVKGTLGYLDPEYYMTNQLTEKSDVYSFGIVILELITGRRPIQNGQYIVREVRTRMDKSRDLYNLHEIIDATIADNTISLVGFERFLDLALRCVEESAATRPRMGDVVKEIESIMEMGGMNPNADSAPTSSNYGETSSGNSPYLYSDKSLFEYSGSIPSGKVEPL